MKEHSKLYELKKRLEGVGQDVKDAFRILTCTERRHTRIRQIIEIVDERCLVNDGDVPPILTEMKQEEISEIYALSKASCEACLLQSKWPQCNLKCGGGYI